MELNLQPAFRFGELLSEHPEAAAYYDSCSRETKRAILLRLGRVGDLETFVRQLPQGGF